WTSQDPLGFAAGDTNLYRYVKNAPTDATDPGGLDRYYIRYHSYHIAFGIDLWAFENWRWVHKGQRTFHYSPVTEQDVEWYWTIPALINGSIGALTCSRAQITVEKGIPADRPANRFRSTPAQDLDALRKIVAKSKEFLLYNIVAYNCISFAVEALGYGLDSK